MCQGPTTINNNQSLLPSIPPTVDPMKNEKPAEKSQEPTNIIDKLNSQCKRRADASNLKPGDEHYGCYELCKAGHAVFKHRWFPLLYTYWAYTAYGLLTGPSLAFTVFAYIITYFYIEVYGAVLHIVLDNPLNLELPLLWDACYEFQFHHIVPHEICVRSYVQICGDLNLIIGLQYLVVALAFGGLSDPYVRTFACCAIANAYLGQYAHRQAHFLKAARDPIAIKLQNMGLIVSGDMHRAHHKTYTEGFPILSGLADPLMTYLNEKITNRWVWVVVFLTMTLGGIAATINGCVPMYEGLASLL